MQERTEPCITTKYRRLSWVHTRPEMGKAQAGSQYDLIRGADNPLNHKPLLRWGFLMACACELSTDLNG